MAHDETTQRDYTGLDRLVAKIIDAFLVFGASATLAYYLVFFSRLPAWVWYPACVVALIAVGWLFRRIAGQPGPQPRPKPGSSGPLVALILLCLLSFSINLFTLRPDADEFCFYHRALHAAEHLAQPISLHHTAHDLRDLPPISPAHLLSTVEIAAALLAKALHLPAMTVVHQGLGGLTLALLPLVYFLLFRILGRDVWPSLAGVAGVLIFLALSGDTHQAWGNFTILRAWEGKCVLIALGLPLFWAFISRFMRRGEQADLLRLHALMLLSIGLSGSAFFLVPYSGGLLAMVSCLTGRANGHYWRNLARLTTVLVTPAILALAVVSPFFVAMSNFAVWSSPNFSSLRAMATVIGSPQAAALHAALSLLLLYHHWRDRRIKAFLFYAVAAALIPIMPLLDALIVKVTMAKAYWRLAYAIPLPALYGLAAACLVDRKNSKNAWWALLIVVVCLGLFVLKQPAINQRVIHGLHQYKFPPKQLVAVEHLSRLASQNAVILAPAQVAWWLGLLRPDLRFVATFPMETKHAFDNYGQPEEGIKRRQIAAFLNAPPVTNPNPEALRPYLTRASLLVLPRHAPRQAVEKALAASGERWSFHGDNAGWLIWLKE
ncbi:hypothetical protein Deba_2166 [Desulfarculus baarsii DSM 2075]|uniref:Glycosyltransferase RgtA/B/C/D-like domain-containing protein n=1 Tax=Desulfarculus baarsii (strain ATCC 33931 / DSM 2075 / LMG 7858 / VKM B-1802 / 2st14) TaxID=644282 RepID=E1QIY7_DESB2|nr:DUF6077 domain-containing protein [Desulfarculus baarsii]ADK85530.1 hypothetical protein Deba_2166 [Desulfarculus baarsii DSM 2075]